MLINILLDGSSWTVNVNSSEMVDTSLENKRVLARCFLRSGRTPCALAWNQRVRGNNMVFKQSSSAEWPPHFKLVIFS